MPSKLFERRKANKATPHKASGEGFLSDRDEKIEEVDTTDVRLAAKKKAEVPATEAPANSPNPFKQWSSNALLAVSETLTHLDEYATDKSIQGAVVQIAQELNSRPVAPPAPEAPRVASVRDRILAKRRQKKADLEAAALTGAEDKGPLAQLKKLLYSLDGTYTKLQLLGVVEDTLGKVAKKADMESAALTGAEDKGGLATLKKLLYSLDGTYTRLQLLEICKDTLDGKVASKKKADGVSIDVSPDGQVHVDVGDTTPEPLPMLPPTTVEPISPMIDVDPIVPLAETPVDEVDMVEDIDYPKDDWEAEVSNDLTKLSYVQWVAEKQ